MSWLFRPVVLIGASLLMVALAGWLAWQSTSVSGTPRPLPVPAGSAEVAFLYPAASTASWDRLVEAVKRIAGRHGLEAVETGTDATSPLAVPEVTLRWRGEAGGEQLLFRWYKLTSLWKASDWADALARRGTPPVAVISGNSTHWAREAALALRHMPLDEERRPLLLLTTATADLVALPEGEKRPPPRDEQEEKEDAESSTEEGNPIRLHRLYPGRTYRFCFTNRQMATAITLFVWGQRELKPDGDPAFLVQWTDDSYSMDLGSGYQRVLSWRATEDMLHEGAMPLGLTARAPAVLGLPGLFNPGFRHSGAEQYRISSSIGPVYSPNASEDQNVEWLLQCLKDGTAPRRPLLAVTGQAGPSRRFLRHLAQSVPLAARRFVVVTGDTIAFDDVYRDRLSNWPVQQLPFHLVFFCHRDPVNADAGFPSEQEMERRLREDDRVPPEAASGTEALLLYQDVVEALALASRAGGPLCTSPSELRAGLAALRLFKGRLSLGAEGVPMFRTGGRSDGLRQGGSGEYVVHLRPLFDGERVLPRAEISTWRRQPRGRSKWKLTRRLEAHYEERAK